MAEDEKGGREKPRPNSGYIPSYLPSSIGRNSDDELKKALSQSTDTSYKSAPESKRQPGSSGRVIKHAAAILVATLIWGLVSSFIWPDLAVLFEGLNETTEEAFASLNAMTQEDRDQLDRAMDGWVYLGIGAIVVLLIGFTVSAALKEHERLKHVLAVAFVIWLVNSIQILIGTATIQSHAFSIVKYALLAMLAVGLSFIFVKSSKDELPNLVAEE